MTNREIDMLIAEKVMGWSVYHYDKDIESRCFFMLMDENFDPVANDQPFTLQNGERKTEEEARNDCPHFSSNITDAWQVVESMRKSGFLFTLQDESNRTWSAIFELDSECEANAEDAPKAICLAAIDAKGVEM